MDSIFFSVKRAHHATLKFTRPLLAEFGLTPARFDLLYALSELRDKTQITLRRMLGVARATISEMLAALERLGLVARERDTRDRRTWRLRLTASGTSALDRVLETHIDSGFVALAVDYIVTSADFEANELWVREGIDAAMNRLKRAFGDSAGSLYEIDLDRMEGALIALDDPHGEFVGCGGGEGHS